MTATSTVRELLTSRVYASNDFLLFITDRLNSATHQHPALQINLSLSGEEICADDGNIQIKGDCLLIDSNNAHRIISACRWQAVLLLSAQSEIAGRLQHRFLNGECFAYSIKTEQAHKLKNQVLSLISCEKKTSITEHKLGEVIKTLGEMAGNYLSLPNPRIKKLFSHLQRHNEKTISHIKLAKVIAISDSHLSHLFRQETGISLRHYRLWQRTLEGTNLMLQGKSITDASLESGFSDTAHFSRSFKRQFGLSPSTLKQHAKETIWLDINIDALLSLPRQDNPEEK